MRTLPFLAAALLACGAVAAADLQAGTLSLGLDGQLRVTALAANGKALAVTAAPFVSLCEVDRGQYVPAAVAGGSLQDGLRLDFPGTRTRGTLTALPSGGALRFNLDLQGEALAARGLLLRFSLPFDATGWQWYSDMQSSSPVAGDKLYENVVPLRAYADLPEWKDKPALRMGYCNRNFCTVLSGAEAALALAVPLDRPCIFRTAYEGPSKRLDLIYDFALSPDSRRPNAVSFAFDLYDCDPAWGMRSALARYYQRYPEMFKVWVPRQGQWMAFNRLSEIDNANEFWFALQEGASDVAYDDKIDVLSTIYYTHAGMPANLPKPYDPEKDPLPPYEAQVAAVNQAFKSATKQDGMYDQVGTRKPDGRLAVEKWSVYAHLIAQFNLDPELPWGDYLIKNTITRTEAIKAQNGGALDGFYYDGLTAGLNYNAEHFKTHEAPILWDPVNKQPYLNNFYSSVAFARATAELLRPRGQVTMMNGALGDSFYVVPWLDILGAETGLRIPRADFNYIRTVIYHKPFLTLLKGNYEKSIARPEMELFMKRCLAYGVYPGFFDWPPSGLGPGGQYWNHPRYYERDRDLFRKYEPLCRSLALAGWEPVTCARSSDPAVYVERYGPDGGGLVWLTALNEEGRPHPTTLTVDAKALGLDPKSLQARDVLSGRSLPLQARGGALALDLAVPPDGVFVLQLGSAAQVARWHVGQSLEAIDRGVVQRRVDAARPALAVHWRPGGAGYDRERAAEAPALRPGGSMRQWAMLFQSAATPLKLRVRARAQGLSEGAATVTCNLAWVTSSYSHYEKQAYDLPGGTYGSREFTFALTPAQALRAVEVTPALGAKAEGKLWIESLSLSDAEGQEYLVDGALTQWYEPLPGALGPVLEGHVATVREGLAALDKAAGALASPAARDGLGKAFRASRTARELIAKAGQENGCRRVLRDLDTVEAHLGHLVMASYGVSAPAISGPATAAAGDTVALGFAPPGKAAVPLRTELVSSSLPLRATKAGARLTIPATAKPGDSFEVSGLLHVGKPGAEATVSTSHRLSVVEPLLLSLRNEGLSAATGQARLGLVVRNNRTRETTASFGVTAPAGWQVVVPAPLKLAAGAEGAAEATLTPRGAAAAGPLEVTVTATAGADTARARQILLYIPPEANLLRNGGFEQGASGWSGWTAASGPDASVARSGKQSLRLENPVRADSQASQSVTLNQKQPVPILVQASSKAEQVEGTPGKGYSLYVDIYYTDGTPLYGTTFDYQVGSTGWQLGELYIEPAKPIRNVNVYLLLRGKSGKVWFDDLALMEDPRRQGNLARGAQVTVDSSFSDYDATPLNDGVIQAAGLHWTKEAWASADNGREHWVELRFAAPQTIGRASLYWSLDAGLPRTSAEVQLQVPEAAGWRTVATLRSDAPVPQSDLRLDAPVTADRFRLLQPAGRGPAGRQGLMWVREVELFR